LPQPCSKEREINDVINPCGENTHPSFKKELSHVEWPFKEKAHTVKPLEPADVSIEYQVKVAKCPPFIQPGIKNNIIGKH